MKSSSLVQLYQERLHQKLKEVGKYGRIIFNDHFTIVLFVILGFLSIYYRQLLTIFSQISGGQKVLVQSFFFLLICFLLVPGSALWLMREPDKSYLNAQGQAWNKYWWQGWQLGSFLALVLSLIGFSILLPIGMVLFAWSTHTLWLIVLVFGLLKLTYLLHRHLNRYDIRGYKGWDILDFRFCLYMLCLMLFKAQFGMVLCFILILLELIYTLYRKKNSAAHQVDIESLIEASNKQRGDFYRLVGFFTDVPDHRPAILPQPWLEALLLKDDRIHEDNPYLFIYWRTLLRNRAFASVGLRIGLFFGFLMLLYGKVDIFTLVLGGLASFLTLFQLLPIAQRLQGQPIFALYPQGNKADDLIAIRKIIAGVLFVQIILFAGIILLNRPAFIWWLASVIFWLVLATILLLIYLPIRFRKLQMNGNF